MSTLSDLGERKAIQRISEILSKGEVAVGVGDDCAAINIGEEYLLVSTDMISEHTHIPKGMTPFQIGWFIVAINLSDIAAKGGTPLGMVLSYGLPKDTSEQVLVELTKGADACAVAFNTSIIGGDMKETGEITITGTAFGLVKKDEFMPRKGADVGDIVAVTGTLGKAGAGYYGLKRSFNNDQLIKSLCEPRPRLQEGRILAKQKCVSSCMDLSDGLSSSLYQLSELNDVGFDIEHQHIPIDSGLLDLATKYDINSDEYALHFGGDYELLFTCPQSCCKTVKNMLEKQGCPCTMIGRVTKEKKIYLLREGQRYLLENKGYEHFTKHSF